MARRTLLQETGRGDVRHFSCTLGVRWLCKHHDLGSDHFIIWGGGGGWKTCFQQIIFFTWCLKLDFFSHTSWSQIFFSQRIESQIFFYSHVSSQRYSHYFQGWGKITFFATYQSKTIFSTYRLGQIIFFGQKQRQIIFSKSLPAPPPQIMKWSLPYRLEKS